jgi:RimJ/RimL family protein N-acetyltransferase
MAVIDSYLAAIEYAFLDLGLHKVIGYVYAFNERLVKIHKKLGIPIEQRLIEHVYRDGRYHDVLAFGMLEPEFRDLMKKPFYKFLRGE